MYNLSNECELGNISLTEECDCEHCGDLEAFDLTWCSGGTWWCMCCAEYNDDFEVTKEEIKELQEMERQAKIKYFKKRIKEFGGE